MSRIAVAFLSFLFLVPQGLWATVQLQQFGLSKVPPTSCAVPASSTTTSFSTTDTAVYMFFDVTGVNVGDTFTVAFYGPSGQYYAAASGTFAAATSAGEWCYFTTNSPLLIAGNPPATMLGTWTVGIYYNTNSTPFASATFTITAPVACSYSLSSTSASIAAGGGSGSFNVNVTAGTNCTWSASSDVSWITGTVSGNTVNYTVLANTSTSSRIGHITAAGQTYTVTQAGASVTCSYALSASSATAAAGGGSGSFNVTAGTGCTWTATSSVSWITTTSSGSGNGTVNYTVAANTSTSSRTGAITVGGQAFQVSQAGAMAPGVPAIGTGGVVSAADYSAGLAPGSLISIFGKNLAPSTLQAPKTPLPTTLNGASVQINGTGGTAQLPLIFVSTGQINAQLPFAITGQAQVTVTTAAGASAPVPITILPVAPKLFTLTMDGKGEPIVLHANYTLVSSQSPAQPGEVVIVYLTGLGAVTPSLDAGAAAGDGSAAYPINYVLADVGVTVNGQPAKVLFAGLAPYFAGLYQLNVQLPATLLPGANTFYVVSGQQASQDSVAMAINSNWKMLGSGTVTAAGGQISGTGISITAPPGAVTTTQKITLYSNTSPPPASADPWRASEIYSISGLPATTGAPITITMDLKPGVATTGETWVHVERTDDLEGSFLVPATVSNGRVTATLPAMTATGAESTATASKQPAAGSTPSDTPTVSVWSLTGEHSAYSARKLFLITAPVSDAIQGGAEQMADQLEKTYDYIEHQLGLLWQTGPHPRNFPISVSIEVFTGDRAKRGGEEGSTKLSVQNQGLNLNATFLEDPNNFAQMRLTASHELFHLMQNLWDPSSAPSTWLWMEEAMSTWIEKRMATDSSYVPTTVHANPSVPFSTSNYGFLTLHGLEFPPSGYGLFSGPGNTGSVQEHGYGASEFLEFLTNKNGIKFVAQLLQTMAVRAPGLFGSSSYSPVAAINSLTSQVGVDWRLFCENFMDGKVYSSPAVFPSVADIQGATAKAGTYYFTDPTTTGPTFTDTYGDLSAKIYSIGIQLPGWSQGTTLHLTLNAPGGDAEAIVYLYKPPGTLTKLTIFQNSYDIQNAENLTGKNQGLVIMVSEGRAVAPYTGSTEISLTVRAGVTFHPYKWIMWSLFPGSNDTFNWVGGSNSSSDPSCALKWKGNAFTSSCQGTEIISGKPFIHTSDFSGSVDPAKNTVSLQNVYNSWPGNLCTANITNLPQYASSDPAYFQVSDRFSNLYKKYITGNCTDPRFPFPDPSNSNTPGSTAITLKVEFSDIR